jgi:anti-anti-sigma factor
MPQIPGNPAPMPGVTTTNSCDDASCRTDHRGHAVRLCVTGDLDLATADSLSRVAIGALGLPGRVLVLDLHGVTFCDAAGVNALLRIHRAGSDTGSRLVLTGIQPAVRHVLDLVGLSRTLPIADPRPVRPTGTDRRGAEVRRGRERQLPGPGRIRADRGTPIPTTGR